MTDIDNEKFNTAHGNGWTVDTLGKYLCTLIEERNHQYIIRFISIEKQTAIALQASDKAAEKADVAIQKRFDTVNEFRSTLSDQATHFITRSEVEAKNLVIQEKLTNYISRLDKIEGKSGGLNAGWGYLVGGIGILVAIGTTIANIMFVLDAMGKMGVK